MRALLMNGVAWPQPVFTPPGEGDGADPADNGGATVDATADGDNNEGNDAENNNNNESGAATGEGEGGAPPPPSTDWRDRELRSKHAQIQQNKQRLQELDNENASLREMVERLRQGGGTGEGEQAPPAARPSAPPAAPPSGSGGSTQEQITAEAQRLVEQREFDNAANKAYADGTERYKDGFQKAIDQLEILGGIDRETLTVILGSDDPSKVLFELGSKPDEYRRVMDLPPAKRVAELVKIGIPAAPAPKRPSGATPPSDPIRSQQRPDTTALSDDLSDEEWNRRRLAQRAARHKERQAGAR